jgi:hypothetical protein
MSGPAWSASGTAAPAGYACRPGERRAYVPCRLSDTRRAALPPHEPLTWP